MSTLGDIMSKLGVFRTSGNIVSTSGDVQYIGGCSVHRGMFSTSGDFSTSEGYHEYIGVISSVNRGDIMMHVGDTMSTSGDVQYIGEIP